MPAPADGRFAVVGMPEPRAMQRFAEEMATMLGKPLTVRVRAPSFFAIAQLVAYLTDAGAANQQTPGA